MENGQDEDDDKKDQKGKRRRSKKKNHEGTGEIPEITKHKKKEKRAASIASGDEPVPDQESKAKTKHKKSTSLDLPPILSKEERRILKSKKKKKLTADLAKTDKGPDKFLPLIYDPRKKTIPEPTLDPPPPPVTHKPKPKHQEPPPPPPPPSVVKPKKDEPLKRDEPKPLDDFTDMVQKLNTEIDVLLGKSASPLEDKTHDSRQEDRAFLKLENFAIPQQEKLLQLLYSSGNETRPCHFGGNMYQYYSNVLRCFTPINMQGRYRGQGLFSKSMTAIDVSKVGLKSEETQASLKRKDEILDHETDKFASVAVDDEHYLFLRQLWNFHPSSLPVSMTYENLFAMVPVMEDLYLTYARRIGKRHHVTEESKKRYDGLKEKLESYLKLLLEPIPLLEKRDPRLLMNEEELLSSVIADYGATEEVFERFKNSKSHECLLIKDRHYHDLMVDTLEYRQELESERFQLYLDK